MKNSILIGALAIAVSGVAIAEDYPRDGSGMLLNAVGQPCWKTPYFKANPNVSPPNDLVTCGDAHWEQRVNKETVEFIGAVLVTAHFNTGSDTISEEQRAVLLGIINDPIAVGENASFEIVMGGTDDRGSEGYNRRLGMRRAFAVQELMTNAGFNIPAVGSVGENNVVVSGDQIRYRQATAVGEGTFYKIVITEETILVIDTK